MENVRFLAGYRRPEVIDQDAARHAAQAARTHRSIAAIEQALASRLPPELVRPAVLHLLWSGALTCDLNRLLGAWSEVRLTGEDT